MLRPLLSTKLSVEHFLLADEVSKHILWKEGGGKEWGMGKWRVGTGREVKIERRGGKVCRKGEGGG